MFIGIRHFRCFHSCLFLARNKTDDDSLRHKVGRFREAQKSRMAVHLTFNAPFGVRQNMYQFNVQNVIKVNNLFKE